LTLVAPPAQRRAAAKIKRACLSSKPAAPALRGGRAEMALHAAGCRARPRQAHASGAEVQQASRRSARRAPHAPPLPPRGGVPPAPLALARGGSRSAERALRAFARDEFSEAAGSPGGAQDEAYGALWGAPHARTHAAVCARRVAGGRARARSSRLTKRRPRRPRCEPRSAVFWGCLRAGG
jgi:hypothetical protein